MRVGIYFGKNIFSGSKSGGAFTFQQNILNLLKKYGSKHSFFIFSDDCDNKKDSELSFVKLNRYYSAQDENLLKRLFLKIPRKIKRIKLKKQYQNPLNKAVFENRIELMWFVTPAFENVDIPFIYTVWDLAHRTQSYFPEVSVTGWNFERREERYNFVIPRASYVIIGNQAGAKDLNRFYNIPDQKIKTIPLPVPDFVFNSFKEVNLKEKYGITKTFLFYPAQFWPHKNHIVILLALKILKEKYGLDFQVVFTGSDKGNLEYIKEKTKELNLQNMVYFLDFVPLRDLAQLYKQAFALVFPSFLGPDNIPPLEAFALNCPVVAANVDGAEYQLNDAAILFDPKSEQDLALAIKRLNNEKDLRDILTKRGKEKVKEFSCQNYIKKIEKIIDEFELIRRCWSSKNRYIHL